MEYQSWRCYIYIHAFQESKIRKPQKIITPANYTMCTVSGLITKLQLSRNEQKNLIDAQHFRERFEIRYFQMQRISWDANNVQNHANHTTSVILACRDAPHLKRKKLKILRKTKFIDMSTTSLDADFVATTILFTINGKTNHSYLTVEFTRNIKP